MEGRNRIQIVVNVALTALLIAVSCLVQHPLVVSAGPTIDPEWNCEYVQTTQVPGMYELRYDTFQYYSVANNATMTNTTQIASFPINMYQLYLFNIQMHYSWQAWQGQVTSCTKIGTSVLTLDSQNPFSWVSNPHTVASGGCAGGTLWVLDGSPASVMSICLDGTNSPIWMKMDAIASRSVQTWEFKWFKKGIPNPIQVFTPDAHC